jgi:hypothetical protein
MEIHNRLEVYKAVKESPKLMALYKKFSNGKPFPSIAPSAEETVLPVVGSGGGVSWPCLNLITNDTCTSKDCSFVHDKAAALATLKTPEGLDRFNKFMSKKTTKPELERFCFAEMAGQNDGNGKCRIKGCTCDHSPQALIRFYKACFVNPGLKTAFDNYTAKGSKK